MAPAFDPGGRIRPGLFSDRESHDATTPNHSDAAGTAYTVCKYNNSLQSYYKKVKCGKI